MQYCRTVERISEDGGGVMICEQWECLEGESHENCLDCGTPTIDGKLNALADMKMRKSFVKLVA